MDCGLRRIAGLADLERIAGCTSDASRCKDPSLMGGGPSHAQPGRCVRNSALPLVQEENAAHAEPLSWRRSRDCRTNASGNYGFATLSDGVIATVP
eukprot:2482375-Alexandrium_andersonii.AAC.1